MRGGVVGFCITLGLWVMLLLAYVGIETIRGHDPFAWFAWVPGGRYVSITVAVVLALGTGIGIASDRVRSRTGR